MFTSIGNRVGPCPVCGRGFGRIPDGNYRLTSDTLELVSGASQDEVQKLYDILKQARDSEQAIREVEARVPALAPVVLQFRKSGVDWKFWVPLILAILSFILAPAYTQAVTDAPPSREEIAKLIEERLPRSDQSGSSRTQAPAPIPAERQPAVSDKQPRNAQCGCESGQKYKRCCGRPAEAIGNC